MKKFSPKKEERSSKSASLRKGSARQFFTSSPPERTAEKVSLPDFRLRLGGLPLEKRAGFALISLRLRQLLRNTPEAWETIEREEAGSVFALFRKYHLPLLLPLAFFFLLQEVINFVNIRLFLRHVVLVPVLLGFYLGYIFLIGMIAEELAEHSGGRFVPESGMRIAVFSTLIISFLSVAVFLPVIGKVLLVLGVLWHYQQLFAGARTLLHLSGNNYRLFKLSQFLVWVLFGLVSFLLLSIVSFLSAKLGFTAI